MIPFPHSRMLLNRRPSGGGGGTDPLNASVVLRNHFNGTNGSTSFPDTSLTTKTVGAIGNAQISTAQSVFGGASVAISSATATAANRVEVNHHSQLNLAGSDFCIELRVRPSALYSGVPIHFLTKRGLSTSFEYFFYYLDGNLNFAFSTDGTSVTNIARAWTPTTGAWNAPCVDRDGANLRFFAEGNQLGSTYNIGSTVFHSGTEKVGIFSDRFNSTRGDIWIDELRVTKASRRTANYTLDAAEFPDS